MASAEATVPAGLSDNLLEFFRTRGDIVAGCTIWC